MKDELNNNPEEEQEYSSEQSETDEEEHKLENWVIVFESAETMEIELIEARFNDAGIDYHTHNEQPLRNTVGLGTSWAYTSGNPIMIFVRPEDEKTAIAVIEEDRSNLLDNPDLDFGKPE